jgi:hypothetical protein
MDIRMDLITIVRHPFLKKRLDMPFEPGRTGHTDHLLQKI